MSTTTPTESTMEESPATSTSTTTSIAALGVKLPPYWPADPHVWFAQVEAQFSTRRITNEDTKYSYIIAALNPEIAQEVRDLIISKPPSTPYSTLKEALIRRTSASEQKRLQQLLTEEELGDRKPSQLLRRMRQLLGDRQLESSILKQLFINRLPTNVQLILASTSERMDIAELADMADKIVDIATGVTVNAVASPAAQPAPTVAQLQTDVQQLAAQVNALSFELRRRERSRSRSGQRGSYRSRGHHDRSPSPRPRGGDNGTCWYHATYGDQAHNCRAPCTYGRPYDRQLDQGNANASE